MHFRAWLQNIINKGLWCPCVSNSNNKLLEIVRLINPVTILLSEYDIAHKRYYSFLIFGLHTHIYVLSEAYDRKMSVIQKQTMLQKIILD